MVLERYVWRLDQAAQSSLLEREAESITPTEVHFVDKIEVTAQAKNNESFFILTVYLVLYFQCLDDISLVKKFIRVKNPEADIAVERAKFIAKVVSDIMDLVLKHEENQVVKLVLLPEENSEKTKARKVELSFHDQHSPSQLY
jgi:hypothetical protein